MKKIITFGAAYFFTAAVAYAWSSLPSIGFEISGAALSPISGKVFLVSDEVKDALFSFDFQTGVMKKIVFARDRNSEMNDLEAMTNSPMGNYYMTTSMSLNSQGEHKSNRVRIGRFSVDELGLPQRVTVRGDTTMSLRHAMLAALEALPNPPLDVRNRLPKEGGLDVEALAYIPAQKTPPEIGKDSLLIGLRGPLSSSLPGRAFFFYLTNPDAYIDGREGPILEGPHEVDLGNQGFRSAELIVTKNGETRLLAISGNMAQGGDPHGYLVDLKTRDAMPILLPANSEGRAIEAITNVSEANDELCLFDDRGAETASQFVCMEKAW